MGLINKIIFKIYDGQLKSVEEKQKELIWDNEVQIEENILYRNTKDPLDTYDCIYVEENKAKMLENISNGLALEKLKELVSNQGGDITYIEDTNKFKKAKYIMPVMLDEKIEKMANQGEIRKQDIVVKELNAEEIGKISVFLGGGRIRKEDKIDSSVGIILNKKIGDNVTPKDIVAYIHANDEEKGRKAVEKLKEIYKL